MPRVYTIYALMNDANEMQYVGCTCSPKLRKAAHRQWQPTLRFTPLESVIGRRGFDRERELIQQHQPPLNTQHTDRLHTKNSPARQSIREFAMEAHLRSVGIGTDRAKRKR